MVKVLENRVVDLDVMPDKDQQELQATLRKELDEAGGTKNLSDEQKKQVQGVVGNLSSVATGLGGTVGGAVKGVVDMAGNTVGGVVDTAGGVVGGVGDAVGGLGGAARAAGGSLKSKGGETSEEGVETVGTNVGDIKEDIEASDPTDTNASGTTEKIMDTADELGDKGKVETDSS